MIEIKRNCSSSIKEDPTKYAISFGDFTIRIDDGDWVVFDCVRQEMKLSPVEVLKVLIYAGLDYYYDDNTGEIQ